MGLSILALAVSAVYAKPKPILSSLDNKPVMETEGVTSGPFYNGELFTLVLGKCDGVCNIGVCDIGHCNCLAPLPTPPSNDCPPSGTRTNHCDGVSGQPATALCRRNNQCNMCTTGSFIGTICTAGTAASCSVCTGGRVGATGCTSNAECNRSCITGRVGDACGDDNDCNVYANILSTGFEKPDGWDLNNSVCGDDFAFPAICNYPTGTACVSKDHVGNKNCCPDDPNVSNGWSMSPSGRYCQFPGIVDLHPSTLKTSSTQHLRFQKEPLGGSTPGCTAICTGDGNCLAADGTTGCRQRYITSEGRVPQISRSIWKKDIAFNGLLGTSLDELFGEDTHAGSIFSTGSAFWRADGVLFVRDDPNATLRFLGYWKDTIPNYAQFTVDFNPCENKTTYSYDNGKCLGCLDNGGTPLDPTDDTCTAANCALPVPGPRCCTGGKQGASCTTDASCNLSVTFAYGFTAPYGDIGGADGAPATTDTSFASTDHFNTVIDIDNFFVTHTPCTEACCDNTTGLCTDLPPGTCTTKNRYPNMKCAQLGTPGYPPACAIATGSCCDSGPRQGGRCTNGVLEADCTGDQFTWVKGGSCSDVTGYCHVGLGACSTVTGCQNYPIVGKKCSVAADCNVAGFCYAGVCTPASIPGHCEYTKRGYCAGPAAAVVMGRCSGSTTCLAATTGAGCCDPGCAGRGCPGTETCVVEKQACDNIPGGADCAFCEGCTALVQTPCSNIGGVCAAQGPALTTGICVANPKVPCNISANCPSDTPARTCILSKGSKAGQLCTANAQCSITGSACEEHTGACCNYVKADCVDDSLEEDCKDAQDTWFKLQTCADILASGDCFTHQGACCDEDSFGGCEQTSENDCALLKKGVFYKEQDCSAIVCEHKAIPTVSEWGIVVLTLLLLVGAKVYFGRRQASAA